MDERIETYINKQKSPQKEIIKKLRKIILDTLKCNEDIHWGVLTYDHAKYYLAGLKDSVNLGFSIKGLQASDLKLFKGTGKTMRHIKIRSVDEINKANIVKLLKLVDKKAERASCCK